MGGPRRCGTCLTKGECIDQAAPQRVRVEWPTRVTGQRVAQPAEWTEEAAEVVSGGLLRLLDLTYDRGPTQLAVTEVVLDRLAGGRGEPTLRLYSWSEPVVILGVAQPSADLDLHACASRGYRVLRRISGGTAVFHDAGEISLEVTVPVGHPLAPADILTAYARFGAALQDGLSRLGIAAVSVSPDLARSRPPAPSMAAACFGSLAPHELTAAGRKLIGLSQIRRRRTAVLQAAVYLRFSAEPLAAVLAPAARAGRRDFAAQLAERVIDVHTAAGRAVDASEFCAAMRAAMVARLALPLERAPLVAEETEEIERLAEQKYASPAWTFRR